MRRPNSRIILQRSQPRPALSGQLIETTVGSPGLFPCWNKTTSSLGMPIPDRPEQIRQACTYGDWKVSNVVGEGVVGMGTTVQVRWVCCGMTRLLWLWFCAKLLFIYDIWKKENSKRWCVKIIITIIIKEWKSVLRLSVKKDPQRGAVSKSWVLVGTCILAFFAIFYCIDWTAWIIQLVFLSLKATLFQQFFEF